MATVNFVNSDEDRNDNPKIVGEARIERTWCEECGVVHYVQVMKRDGKGQIVETKCHGQEFLPVLSNLAINPATHYVRHKLQGFDIRKKMVRKKFPSTFKRERVRFIQLPTPVIERVCIAEISLSARGRFVTIKVFEDATPEKFYEFFESVADKPTMIKTRNLGKDKPVHISDIPTLYGAEGKTNLIFHHKEKYEKLLTMDFNSAATILEKNMRFIEEHYKKGTV